MLKNQPPKAKLPLTWTLPLAGYKFSLNKLYAGTHWSKRKSVKDGITGLTTAICRPVQKVESYPVEISYRFSFVTRPLDTLNCAALAKMFEDALCAVGFLEDDDPKYVRTSILTVDNISKRKNPKGSNEQRPEDNEINEDQVVITINSIN